MTSNVMMYSVVAAVSRACMRITLTILHQVAGWDRDALLQFADEYKIWFRKYMSKDKATLHAISKVQRDIDLQLYIDDDNDNRYVPGYGTVKKTWRSCVKIILAILQQEGDANEDSLKAVIQMFDDWMKAYKQAHDSGEPNDAVDLMNETMVFCGMDPVTY